ncbi:hypothetical protein HK104_000295 [Borealophlyctis nickersoniae]|nr:hypothetical protein HK104_000295 [Borealophlyctis nickersoniae]
MPTANPPSKGSKAGPAAFNAPQSPRTSLVALAVIVAGNTLKRSLVPSIACFALLLCIWQILEWLLTRSPTTGQLVRFGFLLWLYARSLATFMYTISTLEDYKGLYKLVITAGLLLTGWSAPTLHAYYRYDTSIFEFLAVSFASFLALTICGGSLRVVVEQERNSMLVALWINFKFSLSLAASHYIAWLVIAVTLWQEGKTNAASLGDLAQLMLTIAIASVGYPTAKFLCLKALQPAWHGSVTGLEVKTMEVLEKDMMFIMAYECFFGVAGQMVVLRQRTFVAFILSLLVSSGFEFGRRLWEAVRFRRRMLQSLKDDVRTTAEKSHTSVDGDQLENGVPPLPPKPTLLQSNEPIYSSRNSEGSLHPNHVKPSPETATCSKSLRAVAADDGTNKVGEDCFAPLSRALSRAEPGSSVSPLESAPLMRRWWGAHNLAVTAANNMYRVVASFIVIVFVSMSPEARHACNGFVEIKQTLLRIGLSSLVANMCHVATMAAEERLVDLRYQEVVKWLPPLPWYSYGMAVFMAVAGGIGPMLSVDAGLFGRNSCFAECRQH